MVALNGNGLHEYKLVKVLDGDTVLLEEVKGKTCENQCKEIRVRLIGVDAPEQSQSPWGQLASQFLSAALKNPTVYLEYGSQKLDKYKRTLAYVYNSDKQLINRMLLENGYAEIFILGENRKHLKEFKQAETRAREQNLNIWNPNNGLTLSPIKYRQKYKKVLAHAK